jgi:putative ABC transport system permease protein
VNPDSPSPPVLAERLLAAALGGSEEWHETVLGDLHEEYVTRAHQQRGVGPRIWYWREALRLSARFGLRRLSPRARAARRSRFPAIRQETFMGSLGADVRYALRAIRKQPAVSCVVALTLALGLGVNATVLGMMDAMLLRPFQFRDYHRLVVLWETTKGSPDRETVAPANFLDWRTQARSVEQLAAWQWLDATLTGTGDPERVQGFRVSPGFFELLGIAPTLGRPFMRDEEQPGNDRRVVIGDALWKRRYGADRAIVGTTILVDGLPHTVVAVAPPGFAFPVGSELWVPLSFAPDKATNREMRMLTVAGKLAEGQSVSTAQAEMDTIGRRLEEQYPQTNRERGVLVRTLSTAFREGSTVPFVGVLQTAGGLVLLVACANVAGLLLARSIDRQRELALRTALGASRRRIIRQLVTETVVLGLLASLVAMLLASVALDGLRASLPADTARFVEGWDNLRLDSRLLFLIPALAIGVGLVVGLFPALAATRTTLTDALREGDRGVAGGVRRQRGREMLVVLEIAAALALLVAAGLTLAGGARLVNQPGGFDPRGVLTLQIPLPDGTYGEPATRRQFAADLLADLEAIPTVERAALASVVPTAGWNPVVPFMVEDQPAPDPARLPRTGFRIVSPGYFDAMRIPLVSGRPFSHVDREDDQPVAIVSASLAQRYWPGQDPTGKRIRLEGPQSDWRTIVGVAGDVRMYNWWDGEDPVAVYIPLRQSPPAGLVHAVVKTQGDAASIVASVRQAVRSVDPMLPISGVRTMQQAIEESSAGLSHMASLIGICGGVGLVLAIVGIYSVMSYTVSQRTHEFGIRMALGASAPELMRITLSRAGILTGLGVALGSLMAVGFGRLMSSAFFGVVSLHATTFLAVGAGLAVVSLAAACLPARRTLRLDPAAILRGQ